MSTYYSYYIGYEHENKIYPLGAYNCFGKLKPVVSNSRNFASDLHKDFYDISDDMVSDELRKEFEYTDWNGEKTVNIKYLPFEELPNDSYVKKGYFLIEDVKSYEKDGDAWDIFYDTVSPTVYATMVQHESMFGKYPDEKDEEGYTIKRHSASDYMYYAYPDYHSKEYEADVIRTVGYALSKYESKLPKESKLVALLSIE